MIFSCRPMNIQSGVYTLANAGEGVVLEDGYVAVRSNVYGNKPVPLDLISQLNYRARKLVDNPHLNNNELKEKNRAASKRVRLSNENLKQSEHNCAEAIQDTQSKVNVNNIFFC